MRAGNADGTGLAVEAIVERGTDGEDASAASFAGFEHDHRSSRLTDKCGGTQARQARADHDDRSHRRLRLAEPGRGYARGEREPEKLAPIHRNVEFGIRNLEC